MPRKKICRNAISEKGLSRMSAPQKTFLAVFTGSMNGEKFKAWHALPEAERKQREQQGMAAWQA
jgi:hypothetical protein